MHPDIVAYHDPLAPADRSICEHLAKAIEASLPQAEGKVWHAHPVWFIDGNPIVGYSRLKDAVRLLFWSGQSFQVPGLVPQGTFKAAEARFSDVVQIDDALLSAWLGQAAAVQWDYKNIVKRKGRLEPLLGVDVTP